MVDADVDNVDLYLEALKEFQAPSVQVVREIRLEDETISPALRGISESDDPIGKAVAKAYRDLENRETLQELLKESANGPLSEQHISQLSSEVINIANARERGALLNSLLQGEMTASKYERSVNILQSTGFGLELTMDERRDFFERVAQIETVSKLFGFNTSHLHSSNLTESWLSVQLGKLAEKLDNEQAREHFQKDGLTLLERAGVLNLVSSNERTELLQELLEAGRLNLGAYEVLKDKVDNLLHYCTVEERAGFITDLLPKVGNSIVDHEVALILRSSNTVTQLEQLVSTVGAKRLIALGIEEVDTYVAQALLGEALRGYDLDLKLESSTPKELQRAANQLEETIESIQETIQGFESLQHTTVAQDHLATLESGLAELKQEILLAQDLESLEDVLRRHSKMFELELRYGINLSSDNSGWFRADDGEYCTADEFGISGISQTRQSAARSHWTLSDLTEIEKVLTAMPEIDFVLTPLLKEIQLVPSLGWNVLGARFGSGIIKIAHLAIDLEGFDDQYEGNSSLSVVLAHEIGHGIQIADGPSDVYPNGENGLVYGEGADMHDFDEWMELSEWQIIDSDRHSPGSSRSTVILDGVELPLEQPVEHLGKRIVLQYSPYYDMLTSYSADADFSSRWYAKTSPWEDFAEAFSEYLLVPERLVEDAPEKFLHLEEEFKLYEGNETMMKKLNAALERVRAEKADEQHGLSSELRPVSKATRPERDPWVL